MHVKGKLQWDIWAAWNLTAVDAERLDRIGTTGESQMLGRKEEKYGF